MIFLLCYCVAMLLASLGFGSPWFATFHQVKALGGAVKKGAHGFPVVFWKFPETAAKPDGEGEQTSRRDRVPLLCYYTVFNMEQTEGIPAGKIPALEIHRFDPIEACERIVAEMGRMGFRASYGQAAGPEQKSKFIPLVLKPGYN